MTKCNCDKPEAAGWHIVNDAGITFGTLKQAQNEAAQQMAQWIANIFFTKNEKLFANLMQDIADGVDFDSYWNGCEWQTGAKIG
jgi:hypothetical protein